MSNMRVPQQGPQPGAALWKQEVTQATAERSFLTKVLEFFTRPTRTQAQAETAEQAFIKFYMAKVDKYRDQVAPQDLNALNDRAGQLFLQIVNEGFRPSRDNAVRRNDGKVSERTMREAIKTANTKANLALMELKAHAKRSAIGAKANADTCPQILPSLKDGKVRVLRPAPQIENIVFRGGGAKGIGNPSALVEMEHAGMLSGLKRIVGTSAGALTAICLASGLSAKEFQEVSENIPMDSIKEKPEDYSTLYPQVELSLTGYHAGRALEAGDQISAKSVMRQLEDQWNVSEFQQKLRTLPESDQRRLANLRVQDFTTERTNQMVTFKDLQLLNKLLPSNFKELTLTGFDNTNNEEVYFDAAKTPNMPIAIAGRISMSIPVFFASVKFDPNDGGGKREFVDGGVGSNVPTEAITQGLKDRELDGPLSRTLVMTFDEKGKAYSILHGDEKARSGGANFRDKVMSAKTDERANADRDKIYQAGPNAFVVFHGDIETLDLNASPERQQYAKLQSQVKTLEQIQLRQNQALLQEFETVEDVFHSLTDVEKQALREREAPRDIDYPQGAQDPDYLQTKRLYDLATERTSPLVELNEKVAKLQSLLGSKEFRTLPLNDQSQIRGEHERLSRQLEQALTQDVVQATDDRRDDDVSKFL